MSPEAGRLLIECVVPIIAATVPAKVRTVGSEDHEELIQDCTVSAAQMIHAAESNGKPLIPRSIAHYAIQRTKTGRRAMSASRTDAMSPASALDGNAIMESIDQPLEDDHHDAGQLTLHDILSSPCDDTAQLAGRACDWSEFEGRCDVREQAVLRAIAEGRKMKKLARRFKVSEPRICHIRREIGERLREMWGEDALVDALSAPRWQQGIRAIYERRQTKFERNRRLLSGNRLKVS